MQVLLFISRQLMEVYSKSSDIHLELPSGAQNGPKQLWELPPFSTKTVINIHFKAEKPQNFSTYVRYVPLLLRPVFALNVVHKV